MRGYRGTDLPANTESVDTVKCPFTGEVVTAVRAIEPDVTVIHAQRADHQGNVQIWGITGIQKEAVLAARRTLVTVEEVVDDLDPAPSSQIIPKMAVSMIAVVPGGARPSYALGYYERDNRAYEQWDSVSRSRDSFTEWLGGLVNA
jgi:glutaconate CoA-transferase subunit A